MGDRDQRDFSEYVDAWRTRLARRERERQLGVRQLREIAQACARRLVRNFGAREVYLFGSLLDEELAHERSDIDLAVAGLEGRLYFKALSSVWELLPAGVELDLVPLEQAKAGLAERVKAKGVLLDGTD